MKLVFCVEFQNLYVSSEERLKALEDLRNAFCKQTEVLENFTDVFASSRIVGRDGTLQSVAKELADGNF
jgi:hypothetical protein